MCCALQVSPIHILTYITFFQLTLYQGLYLICLHSQFLYVQYIYMFTLGQKYREVRTWLIPIILWRWGLYRVFTGNWISQKLLQVFFFKDIFSGSKWSVCMASMHFWKLYASGFLCLLMHDHWYPLHHPGVWTVNICSPYSQAATIGININKPLGNKNRHLDMI